MPFTIVTNNDYLEIYWTDDESATTINLDEIKEKYTSINLDGQNNNEFEFSQILNRTNSLFIGQCTIDLSQIKGNISYISMTNCTCLNRFSECATQMLYLQDVKVNTIQLEQLQIGQLNCNFTGTTEFDLYQCNQLTCKLISLQLANQKINLAQLMGSWRQVYLNNCILNGYVDNNLFQAKDVNLMINEENCRNNLDSLENFVCEQFSLSQTEHETAQIYPNLAMSNINNQKTNISAKFENATIDLNKLSSNWNQIQFINCKLVGNPRKYSSQFTGTTIFIQCNDNSGTFDVNPLIGIEATLYLEFVNLKIDFQCLQECKPNQVKLHKYNLDIDQLCGTWNILWLQKCKITQSNTSKKVNANVVKLSNLQFFDSSIFNQIAAQKLEIYSTKISQSYPTVSELVVNRSPINITELNNTITHLSLNDVQLVRFSVLTLLSLKSFNLNIARDETYKTKEEIIKYLRYKKKNKNTVQNFKFRIQNEHKRIQVNQIHVKRLLNSFNICYQLLQTFVSNYE
ncbi:Hypothetical_protein [Hexamita inflata]|uniref:Hypothetical_protein n=1 Tax=Hexamita inflata TaxID=28002 RepID=A0AA86NAK3_9EUKA|nr:Hypothetical protein HINF_LOCUS3401 [Hexamita inflata]